MSYGPPVSTSPTARSGSGSTSTGRSTTAGRSRDSSNANSPHPLLLTRHRGRVPSPKRVMVPRTQEAWPSWPPHRDQGPGYRSHADHAGSPQCPGLGGRVTRRARVPGPRAGLRHRGRVMVTLGASGRPVLKQVVPHLMFRAELAPPYHPPGRCAPQRPRPHRRLSGSYWPGNSSRLPTRTRSERRGAQSKGPPTILRFWRVGLPTRDDPQPEV